MLVTACGAAAQNNAADAERLIEVLALKPGSVVAEIGAGNGALTIAIARHVGTDGRVYTNELGDSRLRSLREAVDKSGVANVQVVEGRDAEGNLPDNCCDAIFMRNVYHHFGDTARMNASLFRALRPGARIAIIDFPPRGDAATAPPGQRSERAHGVDPETVAGELKAAGFEVLTTDARGERWFVVVARK